MSINDMQGQSSEGTTESQRPRFTKPLFAQCTMPSVSIGRVYFTFKGCQVYFFIFSLFLIEIPVSK